METTRKDLISPLSLTDETQQIDQTSAPNIDVEFYPRPDAEFATYRLFSRIAKTGEADVWKAYPLANQDAENPVVLKFYRFRQFCDALYNLPAGPHLLPRLGVYDATGILCEAFPYRALGHLGQHAARFRGNSELCTELLRQIAEALQQLHQEGIQHRDIKPENTLVVSLDPLHVEIADFGSADRASMTVDVTNARGTLRYLAPESAMGTSTQAGDWYSLGLLIAELYSGLKIRSDDVTLYTVAQGKDSIPAALSESPRLRQAVKGLLQPDFRSRWQAPEVNHWLNQPDKPVWDPQARRKLLSALGLIALLVAAAIGATIFLSHLSEILSWIAAASKPPVPVFDQTGPADRRPNVTLQRCSAILWHREVHHPHRGRRNWVLKIG